uniref:Uncharacterized protein n=1 Tax=Myoviridae sp. ctcPl3 TaxID=2826669 RepID=A0A8S5QXH5_9CAUD|nr:MAG TPA: hypothetical protein [Myoviridae sp. ctcPl3]
MKKFSPGTKKVRGTTPSLKVKPKTRIMAESLMSQR